MNPPSGSHRWHDDVLVALARSCRMPPVYVEIGVSRCVCFNKVAPHTAEAHAVDLSRHALARAGVPRQRDSHGGTHVETHHGSSDDFFARFDRPVDLVFVDGDHSYEVARRDFENAAALLRTGGTIAVHDVWPETVENVAPELCGDVYRLAAELVANPDWRTYLYATFPGLLICQKAVAIPEPTAE